MATVLTQRLGFVACIKMWLWFCQDQARTFQGSSSLGGLVPVKSHPLPQWKNARGTALMRPGPALYFPGFLASQAHCTPVWPPRARTSISVHVASTSPSAWMAFLPAWSLVYAARDCRGLTQTRSPWPHHAQPRDTSALAWHVTIHRDASPEPGLLTTPHPPTHPSRPLGSVTTSGTAAPAAQGKLLAAVQLRRRVSFHV